MNIRRWAHRISLCLCATGALNASSSGQTYRQELLYERIGLMQGAAEVLLESLQSRTRLQLDSLMMQVNGVLRADLSSVLQVESAAPDVIWSVLQNPFLYVDRTLQNPVVLYTHATRGPRVYLPMPTVSYESEVDDDEEITRIQSVDVARCMIGTVEFQAAYNNAAPDEGKYTLYVLRDMPAALRRALFRYFTDIYARSPFDIVQALHDVIIKFDSPRGIVYPSVNSFQSTWVSNVIRDLTYVCADRMFTSYLKLRELPASSLAYNEEDDSVNQEHTHQVIAPNGTVTEVLVEFGLQPTIFSRLAQYNEISPRDERAEINTAFRDGFVEGLREFIQDIRARSTKTDVYSGRYSNSASLQSFERDADTILKKFLTDLFNAVALVIRVDGDENTQYTIPLKDIVHVSELQALGVLDDMDQRLVRLKKHRAKIQEYQTILDGRVASGLIPPQPLLEDITRLERVNTGLQTGLGRVLQTGQELADVSVSTPRTTVGVKRPRGRDMQGEEAGATKRR